MVVFDFASSIFEGAESQKIPPRIPERRRKRDNGRV
jgi:hypothetical protein